MTKEVALFTKGALPAHLAQGGGLGNENVTHGDLAIPRIAVLQQLSPQVTTGKPEFIANARAGMLHNSVTNELYEKVYVINLFYDKVYAIFKKREIGGGFLGNHLSHEAAVAHLEKEKVPPANVDIVESANHTLLLLDAQGQPKSQAILSMNGTKLKVSNKWNSEIQLADPRADRFASVWQLGTVLQSNTKGSWYNLTCDFAGWAGQELATEAKKLYLQLRGDLPGDTPAANDAQFNTQKSA